MTMFSFLMNILHIQILYDFSNDFSNYYNIQRNILIIYVFKYFE